jgi:tetratricopeptide (TPR) repeat protein
VIPRQPGVAALAIAAALLAPWPAAASRLEGVEREAGAVEDRLLLMERTYGRPDESLAARASRKFSEGETQFLLGDWLHAAVLLFDAVDQPEFRASADYPLALAYLGDALRNQGSCGSALIQYDALLKLGATPARGAAIAGALDCRVRLRRLEGVEALAAEARSAFPRGVPPEVGYLAAKALYLRPDLRPAERLQRASEAFAAVAPPFHLAAAYFQGVLQVEAGDLVTASEKFERCITLEGKDLKQVEIRELCALALGRVYAEQGRWAESLDRYQLVPRESPRFNEALHEVAWGFVKAKAYEQALRTASMIVDLAPESQMAPEATILTGHLNLRLGHYADATESFNKVINAYAPVRDEIDAILTMHEDPIRYFNELIGRQGKAFDVGSVLPDMAVKWATAQRDVGGAMELVGALESGRRDVDDANSLAVRVEALLGRSDGLDAAPLLKTGWASAEAAETAVARLEGELASLAVAAALPALAPEPRAELERVHAARLALQPRLESMPTTPAEVEARQERMARRLDLVERRLFQLRYLADSGAAAIAGTEAWLEQHRGEIASDESGRTEFAEDLRKQRAVVLGYLTEIRDLSREVAQARDAARGVEGLGGEAALRRAYREAVAQERELAAAARPALSPAAQAELARADALDGRLGKASQRAEALKGQFAAAARARAEALKARVASERSGLADQQAALDGLVGDSRDVIGRIAFRSFSAVRAQFYKLVLKADVGIIDVAWSRKRERLDRIQQLSQQKAAELDLLDRDFRLVLREVD